VSARCQDRTVQAASEDVSVCARLWRIVVFLFIGTLEAYLLTFLLAVLGESSMHSVEKGEITVEPSDPGVIERPREIAPSTSQQHLQRSLRGHSEAGSRQSSSLNRDRRTSPDHIPRIHECWSLEPVRRAHRDRANHRIGNELSSDVSSLDSLPALSRPPLGVPSELPVGKPRSFIAFVADRCYIILIVIIKLIMYIIQICIAP